MSTIAEQPLERSSIDSAVTEVVSAARVWDFHTHLYPPAFGTSHGRGVTADADGLMLWGIDDLLTYHYLIAELFRATAADTSVIEKFWSLSQQEKADLIWQKLFVEATPLSEACRGVVTTLTRLGLDPNQSSLEGYRSWFDAKTPDEQIDLVLELAGVDRVTMTNDVFDSNERQRWLSGAELTSDERFPTVLRFDSVVVEWPSAAGQLAEWGYQVDEQLTASAVEEVRRFLREWIARLKPVYCAMSLPPSWRYPVTSTDSAESAGETCLTQVILPVCQEHGLPLALMIGVNRGVNPLLRDAGDSVESTDVTSLGRLCRDHPDQRVLCTMLARENQHELAVTARKFPNLTPFGCWWFLNNPSLIEEMTRMRMELLGPSFIPQHSDARILEQLLYKWDHSRMTIAKVLQDKYRDLITGGWNVTRQMIERDAKCLFYDNIANLLKSL